MNPVNCFSTKLKLLFLFYLLIIGNGQLSAGNNFNSFTIPKLGSNGLSLPINAPCENCEEVIEKRAGDTRSFHERKNGAQYIYLQKSLGNINYLVDGKWQPISPYLKPSQNPKIFIADEQPNKLAVQLDPLQIKIESSSLHWITFAEDLVLYLQNKKGERIPLGKPSKDNFTVGDEGVKFYNYYEGIDLEIIIKEGQAKTNFIINKKLKHLEGEWLVISNKLQLANDLNIVMANGTDYASNFDAEYIIQNSTQTTYFALAKNYAYDAGSNPTSTIPLTASVKQNIQEIFIPLQWLKSKERVFPITLDPLVTATNNLPQASITGSRYDAVCFSTGCAYNLVVPSPAGVTITDVQYSFEYEALNICRLINGGYSITYGGCRSPVAGAHGCGTNTIGTCAAINSSIMGDILGCIPAPACASYNMNFSMRLYRCTNDPTAGCNSNCIRASSAWIMTVIGRTLEQNFISNPPPVCQGSNANLSCIAQYGVPGYNYTWNPGGMVGSNVATIINAPTQFIVDITDACGNTTADTVNVGIIPNTNPGFTINPINACAGAPVTLTGLGSAAASSYNWSVPGSVTPLVAATQSLVTSYNLPGGYFVFLNFVENGCTFSLQQPISVVSSLPASVSISSTNVNFCSGTPIVFIANPNNGGTAPTYSWAINGTTIIGASNDTITIPSLNNGDIVSVNMTSNSPCANPTTATSQVIVSITPSVVPTVNIVASPAGSVCAGTAVSYTANIGNGGSIPNYQWQLNGTNVGSNTNTFTATVNNGDIISVTLLSNATCASPQNATAQIIANVIAPVTPTVAISANPGLSICSGTAVTFSAAITNGGAAPNYQWQLNGVNVGMNANTFTTAVLTNGDVVSVTLTSSLGCTSIATANASVVVSVNAALVPSVLINLNSPTTICSGTNVNFTAAPTNGGTAPTFQWTLNGVNVGSNLSTYSNNSLNNGDVIGVLVTSSASCAVPVQCSTTVTMTVNPLQVPAVSINALPSIAICNGTNVNFSATPVNGGVNPTYQWQVNGVNVGVNSNQFSSSTLTNGAIVSVSMSSSEACPNPATANAQVIMAVTNPVTPSVNLTSLPGNNICAGETISFNASGINAGTTPIYQWTVNGIAVGANQNTFSTSTLNNGDIVGINLTSSLGCVSTTSAFDSETITVNTTIIPQVNILTNSTSGTCENALVVLTADTTMSWPNANIWWYLNGVYLDSGQVIQGNFSNSDQLVVHYQIPSLGCIDSTNTRDTLVLSLQPTITPSVAVSVVNTGTLCENDTIILFATPINGGLSPSYQWSLNNQTLPINNDTISFLNLNNQDTVSVTMISSENCATPASVSALTIISISPTLNPNLSVSTTSNDTICVGIPILLNTTISDSGAVNLINWYENNLLVGTGPNYVANPSAGLFNIQAILNTTGGCLSMNADTASIQFFILASIVPTLSFASPDTVCAGDTLQLLSITTNAGVNPIYSWTINGSSIGANNDTLIWIAITGNQQIGVSLISSLSCAVDTPQVIENLVVLPLVNPSVSINGFNNDTICIGSILNLNMQVGQVSNYTSQWLLNGIQVASGMNFSSANISNNAVISAVINTTDQCAIASSDTATIGPILIFPPLQVLLNGNTTICKGTTASLVANVNGGNGGPYSYSWNNGLLNSNNHTVSPNFTTSYQVSVTDNCTVLPATSIALVTVLPTPDANFNYELLSNDGFNNIVQFINTSTSGQVLSWDFGDGDTASILNPVHEYEQPGTYQTTLVQKNANGCIDSITYTVLIKEDVALFIPDAFTPNNDGINDDFLPIVRGIKNFRFTIFDRYGNVIFSGTEKKSWNGLYQNDGAAAPAGIYVVKIDDINDDRISAKKLASWFVLLR
jgi:gliding motility-associated-like protein